MIPKTRNTMINHSRVLRQQNILMDRDRQGRTEGGGRGGRKGEEEEEEEEEEEMEEEG